MKKKRKHGESGLKHKLQQQQQQQQQQLNLSQPNIWQEKDELAASVNGTRSYYLQTTRSWEPRTNLGHISNVCLSLKRDDAATAHYTDTFNWIGDPVNI